MKDVIQTRACFGVSEPVISAKVSAHFSDLFSARQIDPSGLWVMHVWKESDNEASVSLMLTNDERDALVEQLTSTETLADRIIKELRAVTP